VKKERSSSGVAMVFRGNTLAIRIIRCLQTILTLTKISLLI